MCSEGMLGWVRRGAEVDWWEYLHVYKRVNIVVIGC